MPGSPGSSNGEVGDVRRATVWFPLSPSPIAGGSGIIVSRSGTGVADVQDQCVVAVAQFEAVAADLVWVAVGTAASEEVAVR